MKYLKLEIQDHDAFALSKISKLTIDLSQSSTFIILGSNGSGKSSLLRCLCQWPDDASRYGAKGYKEVKIEKDSDVYTLRCDYRGGDKYSIIKNDEQLYKGSNQSMFSGFVSQYLNLDKVINSLLLESANITSMNASTRSQWLMQLSKTDYEWALRVYEKIKSQRNIYSASTKTASTRLAQLSKEYPKQQLIDELKEQHSSLHSAVRTLLMLKDNNKKSNDVYTLDDEINRLEYDIKNNIQRTKNISEHTQDSAMSVESVLEYIKTKENILYSSINDFQKRITDIKNTLQNYECNNSSNIENEILVLQEEKNNLQTLIQEYTQTQFCVYTAIKEYHKVKAFVHYYCTEIKRLGVYYTEEKYNAIQTQYNRALMRKNDLELIKQRQADKIEHYENHLREGSVECPKCAHTFINGFNKDDYNACIINKQKTIKAIEEHTVVYNEIHKKYLDISEAQKLLHRWSNMCADNPQIAILLNKYMHKYNNDIQAYQSWWDNLYVKLQYIEQYKNIEQKILELTTKLKESENVSGAIIQQTKEALLKEEELFSKMSASLQRITTLRKLWQKKQSTIRDIIQSREKIDKDIQRRQALIQEYMQEHRLNTFDKMLHDIESEYVRVSQEIKKIEQHDTIISELKEQAQHYGFEYQCWRALTEAMSPNGGVIGNSLVSFLQEFFDDINNFIEQIWNYELNISPIEIDENGQYDMDYNFKMVLDGKTLKDISLGSEAMKYIINLAFRLTALLRLDSTVAFLDEPFTSLDSKHRSGAVGALKNLIDSDVFEQIFIISHHSEIHEVFSSVADVICLDTRNITVPHGANKNVSITYN